MNRVILIGRLTRDPNVSYTNGGLTVARFSVAVDRPVKKDGSADQVTADFPSCIAFGKTAEVVEKYFHQGSKIALEGRIQTGSYNDKDGKKVYTTDVVADRIEFVESKGSGQSSAGGSAQPAQADKDGFMYVPDGVEDEGLPFN